MTENNGYPDAYVTMGYGVALVFSVLTASVAALVHLGQVPWFWLFGAGFPLVLVFYAGEFYLKRQAMNGESVRGGPAGRVHEHGVAGEHDESDADDGSGGDQPATA